MKSTVIDKAYRDEHNADVKERILLVRRILSDKQQHIELVARDLHKSRAWAYKWYKRYTDEGLDGLKNKPRSGRPPLVDNDLMIKIRKELSDSNFGWDFRQVMNIIQKRTEVKYHEVHIYRLLHKWGFISKVPLKKFVRTATTLEEKSFKKGYKRH